GFPQGSCPPDAASWPNFPLGGSAIPLGFVLGMIAAAVLWVIYTATRFGFEARVIGDSRAAAHYAGIRTRRKIVAVMALSGALAGIGGASEIGDFRHVLDPRGLQQASFGYAGIVVAALARLNPFAVVIVAILLGGLSNAGFSLQGATFPAGLVGTLQGLILFCALAGELLVHYRIRFVRRAALLAAATSLIHAVLTISLRASQIVSGLALTIFAGASGLSSYVGHVASLGGQPARHEFAAIDVLGLKDLPIIGPILLHQNALTYLSWALVAVALFYLYRTRPGLHLRAVGESPATADAMGVNVTVYRYVHVMLGGALAGIGGGFLSLCIQPGWVAGVIVGGGRCA